MNARQAKIEALEIVWRAVAAELAEGEWRADYDDESAIKVEGQLDEFLQSLHRRLWRLGQGTREAQ